MSSINTKKMVRDLLKGTYAVNGYYGLPDLVANTDNLIADIYANNSYSLTELADLATWFASLEEIPVLAEYPRTIADLPAVFVFRTNDNETERGLVGDLIGIDEDTESSNIGTEVYGVLVDEQIALRIWATGDGAMRDDLYLAVRELILRGRGWFHAADLKVEWKSGKDGQLYMQEADPHIVHTAEATLSFLSSVQWNVTGDMALDIVSREQDPVTLQGEVVSVPYEDTL